MANLLFYLGQPVDICHALHAWIAFFTLFSPVFASVVDWPWRRSRCNTHSTVRTWSRQIRLRQGKAISHEDDYTGFGAVHKVHVRVVLKDVRQLGLCRRWTV